MKKKKNFIVLIAIALLFILAVPVSAASGTMKLNRTQVSMGRLTGRRYSLTDSL